MRILITGVAGFIGSRLAQWILANVPGAKVFGLDNLSSGYQENVPRSVLWDHYMEGTYDYVFHCAAFAAECLSPFVRKHCYQNNIIATTQLINRVISGAGCNRFVFLSSLAVYGRIPAPFKETDTPVPQDPYGISKLTSEMDIRCAGEQFGLDYTILRLFNVYGPGQSLWSQHRNVFGIWMRQRLEGTPLTVFDNGTCCRAFTYIDDILPTIWEAAVNPQASREVFNVGNPIPMTIDEALYHTQGVIGESKVKYLPARHEVAEAFCSVAKAYATFGRQAETSLSEGLSSMWAWARDAWEQYPERRNATGPNVELTARVAEPTT